MDSTAIFCWELSKTLIYKLRNKKLSRIAFLVLIFTLSSHKIFSQTTDLTTQITGPNQVKAGQNLQYEISFANNGPSAVNNANFFAKLPDNGVNVKLADCKHQSGAKCPEVSNYTLKNGQFKGVIPFMPVNSRVTFVITLNSPSPVLQSSFSCMAHITPPVNIQEIDPETNLANWNSTVVNNTDIRVEAFSRSAVGTSCEIENKEFDFTVKWINNGPADAYSISLNTDLKRNNISVGKGNGTFKYNYVITRLEWKSGKNSIAPSDKFKDMNGSFIQSDSRNFNAVISTLKGLTPKFASGDTITLSYSVKILNVIKEGCDKNIEWVLRNESDFFIPTGVYLKDTFQNNNKAFVDIQRFQCETSCPSVKVKVEGSVDKTTAANCEDLPESYKYNIKWINYGNTPANGILLINYLKRNNKASGTGHATYTYDYSISDVVWSSNRKNLVSSNNSSSENGAFTQAKSTSFINVKSLSITAQEFQPGDTIELSYTYTLNKLTKAGCGRNVEWTLRNESLFKLPTNLKLVDSTLFDNKLTIDINGFNCTSNDCRKADIKVESNVSSAEAITCNEFPKSYDFTINWINNGPSDASGIILSNALSKDNFITGLTDVVYAYKYEITNLKWSSGNGSKSPTGKFSKMKGDIVQDKASEKFQMFTRMNSNPVPAFRSGDTISLKYTLTLLDLNINGCGSSIEWNLKSDAVFGIPIELTLQDTDTSDNNRSTIIINGNKASSTDLSVSNKISHQIANNGDILSMSILFQNASPASIGPAIWVDTLPKSFSLNPKSIQCKSLFGETACENVYYNPETRVLTQTIPVMEAKSALEITFTGVIRALNSTTESNKVYAIHPCSDCVPETNISQTNYQVYGECDLLNAGKYTEATVCDVFGRRLVLSEILEGNPDQNGKWSKISGTGGDFEADKGIFTAHSGTTTTIFSYVVSGNVLCKADTALLKLSFVCESDSLKITAQAKFNSIDVEWTKVAENNVDYFEIYRSEDRTHYYKIGELEGRGTSETSKKYSITDNNAKNNIHYYYKVVQHDFFGKETISNIDNAILEVGDFMVGNIFPNPTDYYFNVSLYSSTDTDVNFRILTTLGQEVYFNSMRIPSGGTTVLIDNLDNLAQGGYYFKVESANLSFTKTLVIARD